jgi:thiol-disulfide isomerase/thioredoxin
MYRCLLLLVMAIQTPLVAQPAAKSHPCEAPAEIQAAINQAGSRGIESLLEQYPNDFWVRLAYIDSRVGSSTGLRGGAGILSGPAEESAIARFRKEYELRPDAPEAAYLYAYSLVHRETGKSIEILTGLTQKIPSFPRAWMTLAVLHNYPNFNDTAKVRKYTENFLALCPNNVEPRVVSLVAQLDRSDTQISYARKLRERIAGKENEETIPLYESLWYLESRIALPTEQAEFQKRVEDDLKFLEGLDKSKFRQVSTLLTQGYQRIGKNVAAGSTMNVSSLTSFLQARIEWSKTNPAPPANASVEIRTAYYKKQLQFIDEWRDKIPNDTTLLTLRFTALSSIPDTSDDVLVREGNETLAALHSPASGFISTASLDVLKVWAQRGLELNRIPALVWEILAKQPKITMLPSATQQSDLYGGSYQTLIEENQRWTTNTNAWLILATTYAKTRQLDQSRSILKEWETTLNARRKRANEITEKLNAQARNAADSANSGTSSLIRSMETSIVSGIPNEEAKYYEACAQVAAAEGRMLDALTFYQSSLRLMYGRSSVPPDFTGLDAGKEADRLWKELGGSPAGWRAWLESIQTMPTPKIQSLPQFAATNRPIPQFSLVDQNNKAWTLDSLKGKTTLLNVWATWCGPCRSELPLLQKLYEQIKDRSDIQVITLNVDSDPKLVEPFLKQNKYSFPSLFAKSFVDKFAGPIGIPMTWISDSSGTIRDQVLGFSGASSDWISQTLKRIERTGAPGINRVPAIAGAPIPKAPVSPLAVKGDIGWLKWEIQEESSGKILASGDGPIHLEDVSLSERSNTPRRLIDKRIKLTNEFNIGMAEYPATDPAEKTGFGLTALRTDIQTFSWEWFNIKNTNRAIKLQEGGELGIDIKRVNDAWEITRTEFISDVSFRIIIPTMDQVATVGQPISPRWRIKIFQGSSITWPSIINGQTVSNE